MSCIINEFRTVLNNIRDETKIISNEEVDNLQNYLLLQEKKDRLKSMILFCKKYLENCYDDIYVYGGFVRDWCIHCLIQDLDCMDENSVDKMLLINSDFQIPSDIDFIIKRDFNLNSIKDYFGNIKEEKIMTHDDCYGSMIINYKLIITTKIGTIFNVDFSHISLIGENIKIDFDVNSWCYNDNKGIFNKTSTNSFFSQRELLKVISNIKEKKCIFTGNFPIYNNAGTIMMRKKYIDRIIKMLNKGWNITNLSNIFIFTNETNNDDICVICHEKDNNLKLNCCSAFFHTNCIFEWIKVSMNKKNYCTCPNCRLMFSPIKLLSI